MYFYISSFNDCCWNFCYAVTTVPDLSRAHKDVRLYDMVKTTRKQIPRDKISLELESFYGQGGKVDDLKK